MTRPQGEESIFFLRVDAVCRRAPLTCPADTGVIDAARLMRDHAESSLIVTRNAQPVGIASVDDLRDLVAAGGPAPESLTIAEIMGRQPVTVGLHDYVFEAIFRMTRHNVQRLAVLDEQGKLYGLIADSDLVQLQAKTPLYTTREIEAAQSIDVLRTINLRMREIVSFAHRAGADIKALAQLISHLNDTFTLRVIELLKTGEGIALPEGAAYLALGSEGRSEQTLRTDQDSAIVYRDDLGAGEHAAIERFSARLVAALEAVGVPPCPGATMISNPAWRNGLTAWKRRLDQWFSVPKPESMVDFGMFQDFRTLYGDPELEGQLRDHLHASVRRHTLFLPYMARHIVRFPPPLRLFGRFRVERHGKHRGAIDLKKAGIFAITEGASLLGLEAGFSGGSTWDKLDRLRDTGGLAETSYNTLYAAFSNLSRLRLQQQLLDLGEGRDPSNYADPMLLSRRDQDRLREALRGVNHLLRLVRERYRLDLISR